MDATRYESTPFGQAQWVGGRHGYVAYRPSPLPRRLDLTPQAVLRLADAEAALGRLAGTGRLLPNPHLLVRPYLRREAVSSARIEGTQASLADVFEAEADERPLDADVEEVVNYVRALEAGLARLDVLPLSTRLVREMHAIVLDGVRGRERQPGRLRTSQNWIGPPGATIESATFVPPPPDDLGRLLTDWEHFVHEQTGLPVLVEAALLHYQFETMHPFLDGNGRVGRLLIVFYLVMCGRLPEPLLYLSPYFEARRDDYYEHLQGVRERGAIDEWLRFFLAGIELQAADAVRRAERLLDLRETYRSRVGAATRSQAILLVDIAFEQPVLTTRIVERGLGVSRPSAIRFLSTLADAGVLTERPPGPRNQRRWRADEIVAVLIAEETA